MNADLNWVEPNNGLNDPFWLKKADYEGRARQLDPRAPDELYPVQYGDYREAGSKGAVVARRRVYHGISVTVCFSP